MAIMMPDSRASMKIFEAQEAELQRKRVGGRHIKRIEKFISQLQDLKDPVIAANLKASYFSSFVDLINMVIKDGVFWEEEVNRSLINCGKILFKDL